MPAEAAVVLFHVRLQAAAHLRLAVVQGHRDEVAAEFFHHIADAVDRRVGHRPVVQLGLAHLRRHLELPGGPDRPGVHFFHRLQGGDAPALKVVADGPVQGAGAAVADDARVNDDHRTGRVAPQLLGHPVLEEGTDHQVGVGLFDLPANVFFVGEQHHAGTMAGLAQVQPGTLGETVEGGGQQNDLQRLHSDSSLRMKRGRPFRKPSLADGGARVVGLRMRSADRDQSSVWRGFLRRGIARLRIQ